MRIRASVYIAVSIDGFISRRNGAIDFLDEFHARLPPLHASDNIVGDEIDFGYESFMKDIDHIIMGRETFAKVLSFPSWPYDKSVSVLSESSALQIPSALRDRVMQRSGPPATILEELSECGVKHVYVDGGNTIQRFINANCVDNLIISTVPVIIGSGRRLFGDVLEVEDQWLELDYCKKYRGGLTQSKYRLRSKVAQEVDSR